MPQQSNEIDNYSSFQVPPKEILELADYESAPQVAIDSKNEYMLLSYRNTYKNLEELNEEEMSLAGLRVNPQKNIISSMNRIKNLKVRKLSETEERQVEGLPDNPDIAFLTWSPNERWIAFTHTTEAGVELWILELAQAKAHKLSQRLLNANLGNPINWYRNSQALLARILPDERGEILHPKQHMPMGPSISESDGSKAQNRTYQDLLKNPTDEANFETLASSCLYCIGLDGNESLYKEPAIYVGENFSPDGNYILISTIKRPYSYLVPLNRFPQTNTVYNLKGEAVKTISEIPLNETMPKGFMAVRKGKRNLNWRADLPASLFYVEALDEGDPQVEVPHRDELFQWDAPFTNKPVSILKTELRFGQVVWGNDTTAVLEDYWYDTRRVRNFLFNPSQPHAAMRLLWDRNYQDLYSDPGGFETRKNQYGKYALTIHHNSLFLLGEGYTPEGQFPFIDRLNLESLEKERIYQSEYTDKIEELFDIIRPEEGELLIRIQSPTEYPNYYVRKLYSEEAPKQLTHFSNPFKALDRVYKERIQYQRADGVELSGTLYLPADYDRAAKKEKLPLLIWAYPSEFKDKHSAGQSANNPNEFTFPHYGSFVYWVSRGYAVLDDAAFPIVGEGEEEPNDTFLEQLTANAQAAIDAVEALGYIDRHRVAIGGHSYGAFMTANLLTHTKLFACGIARSGAYNRTLTPFGFQSEQRNYWEATEVYNAMSPFVHADKMKTPLLLVHGEADNNPGTFTLQTERYFQALKGLGAPVRMVILPKEKHAYVARENILHLLWEQDQFFEKYLHAKS